MSAFFITSTSAALFAELMALHYDPLYARSQSTNLFDWEQRQTVQADDLSPQGIGNVADQMLALAKGVQLVQG